MSGDCHAHIYLNKLVGVDHSNDGDLFPEAWRSLRADGLARQSLRQLHETHRLQAATYLHDMHQSEAILEIELRCLQQVEWLIERLPR